MIVLVFGLAGSGKSTLVSKMEGRKINLDPGAEYLPYNPDLDVRELVRIRDIMLKECIGPNTSFLIAFERISKSFSIEDSSEISWVDMPGQFEVYILNDFDFIKGDKIGLYLMDAERDTDFKNFIIDNLLFTILSLKFPFPVLRIFTKADLIDEKDKEKISSWVRGDIGEIKVEGVLYDLLLDLRNILLKFYYYQRPIFVSVYDEESLKELVKLLHERKCVCGDMT